MVTCESLYGCCSILELRDLDFATIKNIKEAIQEEMIGYEIDYQYPHVFIAATLKRQTKAAKALEQLGFSSKKILGRHSKNKDDTYLTMWFKESFDKWWKK